MAAYSSVWSAFFVVAWLRKHVTDPLMDTAISLTVPFAAYVVAEHDPIHGSGVIAVVVAGLLLGHKAPILQTAQSRIAERINWRTIAFVLENTVFLLIGLQAEWLLDDVEQSGLSTSRIVAVCGLTLAGGDRAPDGVGLPGPLPADPARPGSRHRQAATVDVHVRARLGRACAGWSPWPRRS